MTKVVGKSVYRLDAHEKVTGKAIYNADLKFPDMLYGKVLHSDIAHGIIKHIDIEKALALEGVVAVVTGQELDFLGGEALKDMPFFAKERIRYHGEPIAAVAAVDIETAEKAISLIEVEYEEFNIISNLEDALREDAILIHPELDKYEHIKAVKVKPGTNICNEFTAEHGDVEKGFKQADHVFEDIFTTPACHHAQIEPFSAIAKVENDGLIRVWTTNSSVHRLRKDLCDALRIPQNRLQVMVNYIGGSFGGKGGLKVEPLAIVLAKKTKNKPVRIVYTREEVFMSTLTRHATLIKIKTGVTKEGVITARKIELFYDTGAYAEKGPTVLIEGCDAVGGPYKIPNIFIKGYCVYTNKIIAGAYRGYGVIQPTWAFESQMDLIAERLNKDPIELRLINALDEGDFNCLGNRVYGVGLKECINKVAEEIEWDNKLTNEDLPKNLKRAKGFACTWGPTKTPSGSGVFIMLNFDGTVNISTSSSEVGQGSRTVLAQIAAEVLNVQLQSIDISFPDTHVTPFDASTTASRTTFHMGNAIIEAASDIVKELKEIAVEMLDVSLGDIVLDNGVVYERGNKAKSLSYKEVIQAVYGAGGCILGKAFYYPAGRGAGIYGAPSVFWMFGAQAVDVLVDIETGEITVDKVVAAHNAGKAINPLNVIQQIEGGVVQGLSNCLFEEIITNNGRVINPNFHDYKIATASDVPEISPLIVEVKDPKGPYGAKGMGESPIIPIGAAISNAVARATGIRFYHMCLKPESVLEELDKHIYK